MRKWSRSIVGVVAITGWLALVVSAGAETCKLETRRLDGTGRTGIGNIPVDYWFQSTRPQSFFMQIGGPQGMMGGSQQEGTPEFSKVIRKEPSTYNSQHPFRGVAKLGSQYFGFVFDTAPKGDAKEKENEAKSDTRTEAAGNAPEQVAELRKAPATVAYERLHFDVNHNGDLTDDQVIESKSGGNMPVNYASSVFPIVDLTIDVDGVRFAYAFTMSVYSRAATEYSYANASLSAAAYREGELVIDGKNRRVVVVDCNSNGRYDDSSGIDDSVRPADGTVYPKIGDMLYVIDPEAKLDGYASPYDPSSNEALHYVAKQVNLGGRFHDLKITAAGDELTLEPSSIPVGYVTNSNTGYRAIVYGEQGLLKVVGDESGKAPLPAGEWRLASYTINKTGTDQPQQEQSQEGSLFQSLGRMIFGSPSVSRTRYTTVSARAKQDYPAVRVTEGQTVELPFGEPYRPVVTVGYREGADKASLSMSLVGHAGEICTNMIVNGGRPAKPKFTISTEKGEVVDTGNFEYG
jgi:hypothetical protein